MTAFKKEPAVIIGIIISVLAYVQNELATHPGTGLSYRSILPLVAGAIIRFAVYSPATVEKGIDGDA